MSQLCLPLFWICWTAFCSWPFTIKLILQFQTSQWVRQMDFFGSFSSHHLNEEHDIKFQHHLWSINSRRTNIFCEWYRLHMFHICSIAWLHLLYLEYIATLDKFVLWYDCKANVQRAVPLALQLIKTSRCDKIMFFLLLVFKKVGGDRKDRREWWRAGLERFPWLVLASFEGAP